MTDSHDSNPAALRGAAAAALGSQLDGSMRPAWKTALEGSTAFDGVKAAMQTHWKTTLDEQSALNHSAVTARAKGIAGVHQPAWKTFTGIDRYPAVTGIGVKPRIEIPVLRGAAAAALGSQLDGSMRPAWKTSLEGSTAFDGVKAAMQTHWKTTLDEQSALNHSAVTALAKGIAGVHQPAWKTFTGIDRHPAVTGIYTLSVKGQIASAMGAFEVQRRSFDALLVACV